MRIIGIDFGERRIGLATADDRVPIAVPLDTIVSAGDPVDEIARAVEEQGAGAVVFGLPLTLTGAEGPQAKRVREVAEALSQRISTPIDFHDERLTSAQADRMGGKGSKKDAIAASILLQAYLDSRR